MQSVSIPALIVLHVLGYGAVFVARPVPFDWMPITLAALLIWISVVDADRFEIPDLASALLLVAGLVAALFLPVPLLVDRLAGALIWPLLFWAVAFGYLQSRGVQGLGFGDVKLMAGLGVWCGFAATCWVVLIAALAGIAVLSLGFVSGRIKGDVLGQSKVAFGPFLCLSAWAVWLSGVPL